MLRDTNASLAQGNQAISSSTLKKLYIAYKLENGDIQVENPTSGTRNRNPRNLSGYVINIEGSNKIGFYLLTDNLGRVDPFGNQKGNSQSTNLVLGSKEEDISSGSREELTKNEEP